MRNDNLRRIAEVWFEDKKNLVYKSTNVKANQGSTSYQSQVIATLQHKIQLKQCKKIDWYLATVANNVYTPSLDAKMYGLLKVRSGGCAHIAPDRRIALGDCSAQSYQLHPFDKIFELTDSGLLRNKNKCLVVQTNAYVLAQECDSHDTKHQWEYTADEKLRNIWSLYCAMHVTDPDKNATKGRQIFMVQECDSDKDGSFTNWEFLSP